MLRHHQHHDDQNWSVLRSVDFLAVWFIFEMKTEKKISISKRDMNEKLVNFWRSFLVKKKLQ